MAAQDLIPALQSAVTGFTATADGKQVTIDAKMTSAQTAIDAARVSQAAAKVARDVAQASSNAAYQAVQSARANLAHQDLEALVQTKAGTFVDVFIYDTSKDSDGGAWRQRCAGTSWYKEPLNTTTRGARREFPAVAVIVAEAAKITIYDGDDPALPMWKTIPRVSTTTYEGFWFSSQTFNAMTATQGQIVIAVGSGSTASGLRVLDFVADDIRRYTAAVNSGNTYYTGTLGNIVDGINGVCRPAGLNAIPSNDVYDVAMTVLPNAPIDPNTGLPLPTIALATGAGISLIRDNGTVLNKDIGAPDVVWQLSMAGTKIVTRSGTSTAFWGNMAWDFQTDTLTLLSSRSLGLSLGGDDGGSSNQIMLVDENRLVGRHHDGVIGQSNIQGLGMIDWSNTTRTLTYARTTTWVSGWQTQNAKGAFLADTSVTTLTNVDLADPLLSYSLPGIHTPASAAPIAGADYEVKMTFSAAGGSVVFNFGGYTTGWFAPSISERVFTVKTSNTNPLYLRGDGNTSGTVSGVSVKLLSSDRSVNNKPLAINGTITRTAVATGAQLVGYSGFSGANYLQQPYNSGLDFGTGDFCVMGWLTSGTTPASVILSRGVGDQSNTNDTFVLGLSGGGQIMGRIYDSAGNLTGHLSGNANLATGVTSWRQFVLLRRSGSTEIYVDGLLDQTSAVFNGDVIGGTTSPVFQIGRSAGNIWPTNSFSSGGSGSSLALIRISATAPNADQIRRIYEDEKVLFQENAACTLFGTSDAVTALAHDPDTGLLHVGTSAGRSTFDGLRRVSNTTTAVTTAISAANGMVIEQ